MKEKDKNHVLNTEEKLVFAVSLIRHGDRAPYAKLETDKTEGQWPHGIGELTPRGMRQEYMLGKKLRKRYVDTFHLIPAEYKPNSLYVLSSSYSRTTMSAECFLAGLYPNGTGPELPDGSFALPDGYQPIPVYTVGSKEINIINPQTSDNEEYRRLMNYESKQQPDWKKKDKELAEDYKRWSKIFGIQIDNIYKVLLPGDTAFCLSQHGLPLPEGLTPEDADKLINTYLYVCLTRVAPKPFTLFMAEGFMTKLNSDFQAVVEGKQKYKYKLFSGHDISIVSMMNALQSSPDYNPPYASHLNFELYQDNSGYYVKVFFEGTIVEFPAGSGKKTYPLKDFQELTASFIKK
jgi:lysosomal acid phosphatase